MQGLLVLVALLALYMCLGIRLHLCSRHLRLYHYNYHKLVLVLNHSHQQQLRPGNNFHRNVIFANEVVPDIPVSFIDSPDLLAFWSRLDDECRQADSSCDVLVIPHNSNLSAGRMFLQGAVDDMHKSRGNIVSKLREWLVRLAGNAFCDG